MLVHLVCGLQKNTPTTNKWKEKLCSRYIATIQVNLMCAYTASINPGLERRSSLDRRKRQMSFLSWCHLKGKRAAVRREEDRAKSYQIDRHSRRTLAVIMLIIALSILDAVFTLVLINRGASEINPIMAFGVKYLLTCASVLIILLNKNRYIFRTRVRGKILLGCLVIPFALVVHWEIYLILFVL